MDSVLNTAVNKMSGQEITGIFGLAIVGGIVVAIVMMSLFPAINIMNKIILNRNKDA